MNEKSLSPKAKRVPPTLNMQVEYWSKGVKKMDEWKEIDIDEYLLILHSREVIQNKLKTESLDSEMKVKLEEADNFFRSITSETEESIICTVKSECADSNKDYWFAYRLLSSKYDQWLWYAQF